jgi:hypothetical protein
MSATEASAPVKAPTNELPQLSTYTAETAEDRIEGLRLIADSVAQQRQVSSKMLIFHPITLATFALVVAIATQLMLRWYNDYFVVATTVGGITMTFLIFIRWMTGEYIGIAEDIDMDWLGEDRVVVVKWGGDIIGSLVLGWADNDAAKKRGRRRRGKAVIRGTGARAWARVCLKRQSRLLARRARTASSLMLIMPVSPLQFRSVEFVLTQRQTPSAFSPPCSTATSTSKKPEPIRPSRKSPTIRATSANAKAPRPGAADRSTTTSTRKMWRRSTPQTRISFGGYPNPRSKIPPTIAIVLHPGVQRFLFRYLRLE